MGTLWRWRTRAATELSTPPDMATRIFSGADTGGDEDEGTRIPALTSRATGTVTATGKATARASFGLEFGFGLGRERSGGEPRYGSGGVVEEPIGEGPGEAGEWECGWFLSGGPERGGGRFALGPR